jgi:hypothetical protein
MPTYRQRQSQYTEPPCVEMDNRYSLLKDAMVRNIKEYNDKFKARKSWKWTPLFIANPKTVRKCHYRKLKPTSQRELPLEWPQNWLKNYFRYFWSGSVDWTRRYALHGNDVVRIQCAFIDTWGRKITDFIGSQKAYDTAYLLPSSWEKIVASILM